jgi:hypothetical protein
VASQDSVSEGLPAYILDPPKQTRKKYDPQRQDFVVMYVIHKNIPASSDSLSEVP